MKSEARLGFERAFWAYQEASKKYRMREIGDDEFLLARKQKDEASAILDAEIVKTKAMRNARARETRKAREDAYRSCGLVKVRGALGGTYWE